MARIHARRRGRAGSKKPLATTPPSWINYKPEEIKTLVLKLAKQGLSTSQIGLTLRDSYGIPDVKMSTKKAISQILKENKLYPEIPEDIQNLIKQATKVKKHLETNKKDNFSRRGLDLINSKIRRLVSYYNKKGRKFKYDAKEIKLANG
jgi:small subunit ribosomal protein S15